MPQLILEINISENGIEVNNILFEFPFLLSKLTDFLGTPNRIYEGEPDVDRGFSWTNRQVWDDLGITTISDKTSPNLDVVELELQLSAKRQYDFMPKNPFLGLVTVDHKKIEELVTITNQYYPYPYKNLNLKDIVINIALIRTKKVNEICSVTIYRYKK